MSDTPYRPQDSEALLRLLNEDFEVQSLGGNAVLLVGMCPVCGHQMDVRIPHKADLTPVGFGPFRKRHSSYQLTVRCNCEEGHLEGQVRRDGCGAHARLMVTK